MNQPFENQPAATGPAVPAYVHFVVKDPEHLARLIYKAKAAVYPGHWKGFDKRGRTAIQNDIRVVKHMLRQIDDFVEYNILAWQGDPADVD